MDKAEQIAGLRKILMSIRSLDNRQAAREARDHIAKAITLLSRLQLNEDVNPELKVLEKDLKNMKVSPDTRITLNLMLDFLKNPLKKPSNRYKVVRECVRLRGFKSSQIDQMLSDEIYLKRFYFIFV